MAKSDTPQEPGALLTLAEVDRRLGRSRRWMQDFPLAKRFGRMVGRSRMFTEDDCRRIVDALPAQRASSP